MLQGMRDRFERCTLSEEDRRSWDLGGGQSPFWLWPPSAWLLTFLLKTTTIIILAPFRFHAVFQPQTLRHQSSSGWCVCLVTKLCPTLCDPMDCSPTVHGISQERIVEWVAISFSRGSSQPRDGTHVYCIAGKSFTAEPLEKPQAGGMHNNITMKMIWFNCVSLSMVTGHTHKHSLNQPRLPFRGGHHLYLYQLLEMSASWWHTNKHSVNQARLPFRGGHHLYLFHLLEMSASWWQSEDQTLSSGSESVMLMTTTRRRDTKWLMRGPEWQTLNAAKNKNKDEEDVSTKWCQMTEVWLNM